MFDTYCTEFISYVRTTVPGIRYGTVMYGTGQSYQYPLSLREPVERSGNTLLNVPEVLVAELTRLGSWMIMGCLGSYLCFDLVPTSSFLYPSPPVVSAEQNNQSTLAWSRQHHLSCLLYWSSRTSPRNCGSSVCPLNCRLCLDRASASESKRTH